MTTIKRTTMRVANISLILMMGLILILVANPAWAGEEQQLVDKAEMTLKNLHKENAWFRDHGKEAKAILLVPSLLRGAFIFGGAGGSGEPEGWLEAFYTTDFRLGGDLSIAVGPSGVGTRGGGITGDFVSFAKSKGVYGGISVDGQGVGVADTANKNYYGKPVRPTDIFVKGGVSNPGTKALLDTANKLLK